MTPLDLVYLVILILSIILHEVAHGYAANSLGDPTARLAGRLTLNPFPHIDPIGSVLVPLLGVLSPANILFGWAKPVPYNPYNLHNRRWAEAAVALAGSATNIALAIIFGLIVRYGAGLPEPALLIASVISFANLFLGLFNLIPFPPLDGFTALRALLPWHASHRLQQFEDQVHGAGIFALIAFLFIFSSFLARPFYMLVLKISGLILGQ